MNFVNVLGRMSVMFSLIGLGFLLEKGKVVKSQDTKILSELIVLVATPALMFNSIMDSFDINLLSNFSIVLVFSLIQVLVSLSISYLSIKLFNVDETKQNLFMCGSTFSNIIFIGLPVIVSLYGPSAVALILVFDFGITVSFWTIGMLILRKNSILKKTLTLKPLLNWPLLALVLSFLLALLGIRPPDIMLEITDILGNIAIPLSLLVIGITIGAFSSKTKTVDYSIILISLIRLFVSPLIIFFLIYFLNIPILIKQVLVILSALPTMMSLAIVAHKYQLNHQYATSIIMVTTLVSLISVPIVIYVLEIIL